jgi:hypothetical protein
MDGIRWTPFTRRTLVSPEERFEHIENLEPIVVIGADVGISDWWYVNVIFRRRVV